ncbi:MAG: helix-turn-helix transcriptional regulator [Bacteroidota bacterium]|nr:helix-turn-helix transcriptional regulator [Bacteroidota bacterium]
MLKIKELCEKNGITLSELAKRAGISRETLSREKWNPSLTTLVDIAKVLNINVSELFQETTKTNDNITGAVRIGDDLRAIDSVSDLEKILIELKNDK